LLHASDRFPRAAITEAYAGAGVRRCLQTADASDGGDGAQASQDDLLLKQSALRSLAETHEQG